MIMQYILFLGILPLYSNIVGEERLAIMIILN